jgi:hypothetical protein
MKDVPPFVRNSPRWRTLHQASIDAFDLIVDVVKFGEFIEKMNRLITETMLEIRREAELEKEKVRKEKLA